LHPVAGVEVVLDEDRDAVQRAAQLAVLPLGVQGLRHGQSIRVRLDDGVDARPIPVEGLDAVEVGLRDRRRGGLA
jgi:hypothetical protein